MTARRIEEAIEQLFLNNPGQRFTLRDVARQLGLNTHPQKLQAHAIMDDMAWDDFLQKKAHDTYCLNQQGQVQEGVFRRKTNGKNSFLPDGQDQPVFVSERNSLFALDGDRVRATMMARRRNHIKEAMVTEILQRARETFVGILHVQPDFAFLSTQSDTYAHDIIIPPRRLKGGKTGDKALVKVTQWPSETVKNMVGEVIDILGHAGENNAEMHAILAKYGLPYRYPKAVEEAAEHIPAEITPQDEAEREDFRSVTTFTIDPKDAKDFDDALSIREIKRSEERGVWKENGGKSGGEDCEVCSADKSSLSTLSKQLYEVGVHIADVSHYVKENSIIDKEAQRRATSVYLVDRTIPMLPERLCNFICSLRPDEDKLCYSVIFIMDDEANIYDWRLRHTIIRSNRRFAYEEVQDILEQNGVVDGTGEPAPPLKKGQQYQGDFAAELIMLDRMAKALRKQRFDNGSVKFEREELHFDVDKQGKPTRCYFKVSKDANKLIEEFMLLANRTVAESIGKQPTPKPHNPKNSQSPKTLPYRIHEQPDADKLENLRQFIRRFGYKLKTGGSKQAVSKSLNKLMDECRERPEQKLIETVALRSMMKAKYSVYNIGHYGLAFDYYTHFTSPIRRYPDTMVHRLLTRYQAGGKSADADYYEEQCEHSSDMEQIAANAERESIKYKMVEFMADKIGKTFEAHISGIQSYGIYCEIDENHCEGMVPMSELKDDYYEFDEKNYCLVGRRRHHRYQLGDAITIQVAAANLEKRQLDFVIVE